jgi:hypothetical protein
MQRYMYAELFIFIYKNLSILLFPLLDVSRVRVLGRTPENLTINRLMAIKGQHDPMR